MSEHLGDKMASSAAPGTRHPAPAAPAAHRAPAGGKRVWAVAHEHRPDSIARCLIVQKSITVLRKHAGLATAECTLRVADRTARFRLTRAANWYRPEMSVRATSAPTFTIATGPLILSCTDPKLKKICCSPATGNSSHSA